MNKSSVVSFILEALVFVLLVWAYEYIWSLSQESIVFMIVIFCFSWLYRYQRSTRLLEYYSHIIIVSLFFFVIVALVTIVLRKASHVFLVGGCAIISWLMIVCIARFVIIRAFGHPYRILMHPQLMSKVAMSHKVKLIQKAEVTPHDLKTIDAIVVDRKFQYSNNWNQLIFHASQHDIPVFTLTAYEELIEQRLSLSQLQENWMYAGFNIPLWYRLLKNSLEFLLSLILLPLLIVVFALVGVIILITMGRPIFYMQSRMGFNNKPFKVYKFRSMVKNADKSGETVAGDMRVTKFGAFMRKFRIDELPQFLNILKGDMSLIGPRPEWIETARQFEKEIPLYRLRHIVRPGITGWAQVTQGHTTGADGNYEKLQYDLYYVKHYSLIMDLKIVMKTIYTILTGFGAK
ncbi:sugar transferase [Cysteiniphilum litorale]|uniref:sugar transferase n=1 Tax=Cysteiniphilum litorale TaxID=2056700 RepID=UPI003F88445A